MIKFYNESLRAEIARDRCRSLTALAFILAVTLIGFDLLVTRGNVPSLGVIALGLTWGWIILWHYDFEINLQDMGAHAIFASSVPFFAGYYLGVIDVGINLALLISLGFGEAGIFLPINSEYKRTKAFSKPT